MILLTDPDRFIRFRSLHFIQGLVSPLVPSNNCLTFNLPNFKTSFLDLEHETSRLRSICCHSSVPLSDFISWLYFFMRTAYICFVCMFVVAQSMKPYTLAWSFVLKILIADDSGAQIRSSRIDDFFDSVRCLLAEP